MTYTRHVFLLNNLPLVRKNLTIIGQFCNAPFHSANISIT